ncbi:MAG: hypothetical protein V4507_11830 [Verrucomicrobiota bacterium]
MKTKNIISSLVLTFLFLHVSSAQTPVDRNGYLAFFNEKIPVGAAALAKDKTVLPLSPPENDPILLSIKNYILKTGDIELIKLLLQYQVAYPNPENDHIARALGEIFFNQTPAFEEAYEQLIPNYRLLVFPYIKFGWGKAIEGKNTSLPSVLEKQKRFDKIAQSLINLRGYQDQPTVE